MINAPPSMLNPLSTNHRVDGKRKKMLTKAAPGRGAKREAWVDWLHMETIEEFDRLRKAGVKFSPKLLLELARDLL